MSIETKACAVGELPHSLNVEVQALMSEADPVPACVFNRSIKAHWFSADEDVSISAYVVTRGRCTYVNHNIVTGNVSTRADRLSDISSITSYQQPVRKAGSDWEVASIRYTVAACGPGGVPLTFQFSFKELADWFRHILTQAVENAHS